MIMKTIILIFVCLFTLALTQNQFFSFNLPLPLPFGLSTASCDGEKTKQTGQCLDNEYCKQRIGYVDGVCSGNKTVCCVPALRCGGVTSTNSTRFVNKDYPNKTDATTICSLQINKLPNVMMVKLEFEEFALPSVDAQGKCNENAFWIDGINSDKQLPKICGQNRGQHLYLPVDKSDLSYIRLNIKTNGASMWIINVIQLEAGNPSLPPPNGCLQYWTGLNGSIGSFNLANGNINGLRYSICFRRESGHCKISFEPAYFDMGQGDKVERAINNVQISLEDYRRLLDDSIIYEQMFSKNQTTSDAQASSTSINPVTLADIAEQNGFCANQDQLMFLSNELHPESLIYCGKSVPSITMNEEPFLIRVRNNGAGRGFFFNYKQLKC